jgi:hypothetical protein
VTEHLGGEETNSGNAKKGWSWPLWKENKSGDVNENKNPPRERMHEMKTKPKNISSGCGREKK